jgi:hypothetical protein
MSNAAAGHAAAERIDDPHQLVARHVREWRREQVLARAHDDVRAARARGDHLDAQLAGSRLLQRKGHFLESIEASLVMQQDGFVRAHEAQLAAVRAGHKRQYISPVSRLFH